MIYTDLRSFIKYLETNNELINVNREISPDLEMTEFCSQILKKNGPAILFSNPLGSKIPVLGNLFGTTKRVALAMGKNDISELREIGVFLSNLKQPNMPSNIKEGFKNLAILKQVYNMVPKFVKNAAVHDTIIDKDDIDLSILPIWRCHQEDVAKLITWGLVVTKGIYKKRLNLGIYRQQVIAKNKLIMRWLHHRGGALDYLEHSKKHPHTPFPISVVIGCDPATILSAVTPIPDSISEYQFAGLLRGSRTILTKCITNNLNVPSTAEIILEGFIYPNEIALEGPFGDHTGYYNEQEYFPVFTVEKITMRNNPIYHSTYTGKPIDEPAILGNALNEVFIPIIQKQFPEIVDFYLPPEGCSYRLAIVSINKKYPGHAKKIMLGVWSYLTQFMYTKIIIIVDDDINIRVWSEVIWALTTRSDPVRDTVLIDNTPIDYLDFASKKNSLGGKMGIDATNKIGSETDRQWGKIIVQNPTLQNKIKNMINEIFN